MDWSFLTSIRGIAITIGTIVLLASITIIILHLLERKLEKKFISRKYDKNAYYQRKLIQLKESNESLDKKIDKLNSIARDFFKEAFDIPYNLEYSEIIGKLKKQQKNNLITFSKLMIELSYTGKKIKQQEFNKTLNLFKKIVHENKITKQYTREELEKLKKEEEQLKKEQSKSLEQNLQQSPTPQSNEQSQNKQTRPSQSTKPSPQQPQNQTTIQKIQQQVNEKININELIKKIDENKRETDKVLYDVSLNNNIRQIVEYEPENEEDFKKYLSSNKEDFERTLKIINPSKKIYNNFRTILTQLYHQANKEQKTELNNIIKHWNKEQKKIINETNNPFKKQIKILQLIDEYLINIKIIASLKLNK
jgi:hypothetical protein